MWPFLGMNFRFDSVFRRGPVGHGFFFTAPFGVDVFVFLLLGLTTLPRPEVSLVIRPCQRAGCSIITRPGHFGTDTRTTNPRKYLGFCFWAASDLVARPDSHGPPPAANPRGWVVGLEKFRCLRQIRGWEPSVGQ